MEMSVRPRLDAVLPSVLCRRARAPAAARRVVARGALLAQLRDRTARRRLHRRPDGLPEPRARLVQHGARHAAPLRLLHHVRAAYTSAYRTYVFSTSVYSYCTRRVCVLVEYTFVLI